MRLADNCLQWSETDLLTAAQNIITEHYRQNDGQCLLFGQITGYRLIETYDSSIRPGIDGSVIARDMGHFAIFTESAVQTDVSARTSCFPSAGLQETGTKARQRPGAALVRRRRGVRIRVRHRGLAPS